MTSVDTEVGDRCIFRPPWVRGKDLFLPPPCTSWALQGCIQAVICEIRYLAEGVQVYFSGVMSWQKMILQKTEF